LGRSGTSFRFCATRTPLTDRCTAILRVSAKEGLADV
jgi:hypothetical protein